MVYMPPPTEHSLDSDLYIPRPGFQSYYVDLLVRCTVDASKRWRMACGACWREASGGVTDGDADHPHYTYGGLWKNRAANR